MTSKPACNGIQYDQVVLDRAEAPDPKVLLCILVLPNCIYLLALSPFPELANLKGPNYGRSIQI
jgi:hypothetical protein